MQSNAKTQRLVSRTRTYTHTHTYIHTYTQSSLCTTECRVTPEHNASYLAHTQTCAVCFPDDPSYGCGGLGLDDSELIVINTMGVAGTLLVRFASGPLIDRFGAKK